MKKIYLFGLGLCFFGNMSAQSLTENFDSYTSGDYIGVVSPDFTTWSGATGGAEDTQVTNANSFSASNSLYFSTTSSGGGPQDCVVPFGGEYNVGQFHYESMYYVESGNGAYFNFQANNTIGQVWALNVQMVNDGTLYMDDGVSVMVTTTFPFNTWFKLALDINLNTNEWELLIDDVSQGVASNSVNQLASIDIFPVNANWGGNNNASFYVDDFAYNYTPYTLPAVNGAPTAISVSGLAGQSVYPTVKVRNLGTSNITSFDLTIDYNGNQISENITGVNIASLDYYDVTFTNPIVLVPGANDVVATISNVNAAGPDGDATDDIKTISIDPVVPAPGKVVFGEEGTGTWCQWCPRGAVFMDLMANTYDGYWAGVAVHNGDPMTVTAYDADFGAYISGYPSALVDRGPDIDPSAMENSFLQRVVLAPSAFISNAATYNSTTGVLTVTVTTDFQTSVSGDWRLACIISEDGVTGTGSGWSQSNAYAGGGNGVMGGFELLPNPVPASQMVYDHVARGISPSMAGQTGVFPGTVNSGEVYTTDFTFTLDPTWDMANMNVVAILIDPSGDVDNAGMAPFTDLLSVESTLVEMPTPLTIYPNPATDMATIEIGDAMNENVSVQIFDINGKLVGDKNYGQLNGAMLLPVNVSMLEAGIYSVRVLIGENVQVTRLVVE